MAEKLLLLEQANIFLGDANPEDSNHIQLASVAWPHTPPMVTLAIRSDGSVESVTFVASSGVPAIDAAIRRIVQSQAPYPPFPPGLTRDYDVLEIRRTWHIDTAIRLY